ncbi:MAG TPA: hypothetical protein VGE02_13960 [Gemmatimonadales bacterium]
MDDVVASASSAATAAASGEVRRKNLNVDQGLLDKVKSKLGLRTETEAVEMGLGALLEIAEFQEELLAGFDDLMRVGGLGDQVDEELDFSGFRARTPDSAD